MIGAGDTMGVYLLESRGIRDLITTVKPADFDELVNVISLYRPAPLEGRLWQRYVENAEKKGKVLLPHHSLAAPLEATRGLLLYREQVREILGISAGLRGEEAVFVEQALLSRGTQELSKARLRFIRGAMDNEVDEEDAQKIFDYLLHKVGYTYDKAYSCTQACISYRSAYLKAHHPAEYFAALLENTEDVKDRRRRYIEYLEANGQADEAMNASPDAAQTERHSRQGAGRAGCSFFTEGQLVPSGMAGVNPPWDQVPR